MELHLPLGLPADRGVPVLPQERWVHCQTAQLRCLNRLHGDPAPGTDHSAPAPAGFRMHKVSEGDLRTSLRSVVARVYPPCKCCTVAQCLAVIASCNNKYHDAPPSIRHLGKNLGLAALECIVCQPATWPLQLTHLHNEMCLDLGFEFAT